MKYLLDTHAFLWAAVEPRKLSSRAVAALEDTDDLAVSRLRSELTAIEPEHIDRTRSLPFHHPDVLGDAAMTSSLLR